MALYMYLSGLLCALGIIVTTQEEKDYWATIMLCLLSWFAVGALMGMMFKRIIEVIMLKER